jgi:hypothetical protein
MDYRLSLNLDQPAGSHQQLTIALQPQSRSMNDNYRVTLHLVGGSTVELLSSTERRRLDNGDIQATWIHDSRRGTVGRINWSNVAVVTWRQGTEQGGVA